MKLKKSSLFALFAVLELAADSRRQLSTTDIADKYGISTHHLAKIMRSLAQAGMVQAVRGVGGGYRFSGNTGRTTLLDVIRLFETLESDLDLPNHWNEQENPIVAELQRISREIDELTQAVLDAVTLKTALKNILPAAATDAASGGAG